LIQDKEHHFRSVSRCKVEHAEDMESPSGELEPEHGCTVQQGRGITQRTARRGGSKHGRRKSSQSRKPCYHSILATGVLGFNLGQVCEDWQLPALAAFLLKKRACFMLVAAA
jgi:hypothetical protein